MQMDPKIDSKTQNKSDKWKTIAVIAVTVILAGIPFGIGKEIELKTPGPFDSGAYVYSAAHILAGAEIGVDEIPSAQWGTLLVNMAGVWMFGYSDVGPKIVQGILQAAALCLMFYSMRKVFGSLAAVIGVVVASVYLSCPFIAKFGNVKEQFMIAFMVLGISCFILWHANGRWWWCVLAGAFVVWAPLFKQTGTSALAAMGIFIIAQPIFKHRSWRQTGTDVLLLLGGAALSLGPIYIWILAGNVKIGLPYGFVWKVIGGLLPDWGAGEASKKGGSVLSSGYVGKSREAIGFTQQAPVVLRYYAAMILPVVLGFASIAARLVRMICGVTGKIKEQKPCDRFVLLLGIWWLLDMGFIWISPRPYEQYYLPLTASAAMLGGYLFFLYSDKFASTMHKGRWVGVGILGVLCMVVMSWHIFFGIESVLFTGKKYSRPPYKRRGYLQKIQELERREKGSKWAWENLGNYIHNNSNEDDTIYVWGWYPGIYVKAQRFSTIPRAFEAEMHVKSPKRLAKEINQMVEIFRKAPPKFIVDTRHTHFPYDGRPPLELWPWLRAGTIGNDKKIFLPRDKRLIGQFETMFSQALAENFGKKEAKRFAAMKPIRDFIMNNYRRAGTFGPHVLFVWSQKPIP